MDQLKQFFGAIKKYHFWILCAIVILVGLTSWYMSTSKLSEETTKNAANIKQKETEVNAIGQISPHPNQEFLTGMDKMIEGYSVNLAQAWKYRYDQQKSLLVWPASMGQDFIQTVNPLRPIEEFVTYDDKGYVPSQEINGQYRERYRYFITDELPKLAAQIGSKWSAKAGEARGSSSGSKSMGSKMGYGGSFMKGGSKSGAGDEVEKDNSVVRWNEANQQEILDVHFHFASEDATPHTLDVLYAQEDLWVLQAIIDVIKRTNAGADANYNAAIKEIESIQMGRTVRGRLGQIVMLDGSGGAASGGMNAMGGMSAPGGSMAPPSGSMSPPSGGESGAASASGGSTMPQGGGSSSMGPSGSGSSMGPAGGGSGSGSMSSVSGPVDPAIGRYVDIDYNPLDPKVLREARTSQDPKQAIYAVAKRMPVALRLRIDQRKLNDLLAECGNSSLPIEVRQVRINCEAGQDGSSRGSGGGSFSGSGSMGPSGSSMGSAPGPGGASSMGPGSMGKSSFGQRGASSMGNDPSLADPNEVVVDVYGIVHIYNPLNQKQLNTNLREDGTLPVAPESPTAATPVEATTRS